MRCHTIVAVVSIVTAFALWFWSLPALGADAPSAEVRQLLTAEARLNDECRGGPGDSAATRQACAMRDRYVRKLQSLGWCWGPADRPESEKTWQKCGTAVTQRDAVNLIAATPQIRILGTDDGGCDGAGGVTIRFRDDGTSGCAEVARTIRGPLESGPTAVLIPVTNDRSTIFDLLYIDNGTRVRFVGILPGDGSGRLSVALERGVIVERNGSRAKYSTYLNGRVVTLR